MKEEFGDIPRTDPPEAKDFGVNVPDATQGVNPAVAMNQIHNHNMQNLLAGILNNAGGTQGGAAQPNLALQAVAQQLPAAAPAAAHGPPAGPLSGPAPLAANLNANAGNFAQFQSHIVVHREGQFFLPYVVDDSGADLIFIFPQLSYGAVGSFMRVQLRASANRCRPNAIDFSFALEPPLCRDEITTEATQARAQHIQELHQRHGYPPLVGTLGERALRSKEFFWGSITVDINPLYEVARTGPRTVGDSFSVFRVPRGGQGAIAF